MARDEASTRFPFINLEKALGRAEAIFAGDKSGRAMPVPVAFQLWDYSPKSSGAFQTVAALIGYGLMQDEGANEERRVRLTDSARRYFLDERDDVRAAMLRDFALNPPLFRALWVTDKWSEGLPADTVARSHLKVERKLNDQSSRALLGIFKDNIVFSGLHQMRSPDSEPKRTIMLEEDTQAAAPTTEERPAVVREVSPVTIQAPEFPQPAPLSSAPKPGEISVRFTGNRVAISADVDLSGLLKLKQLLVKYEEILRLLDDPRVSVD